MAKNLQTVARRALTPCAGADAFRFADGAAARDLSEFRQLVANKSAYLVAHHREHYHLWIRDVLGDPALARKVERLGSKRTLDGETFQRELTLVLDDRIGKLRTRVV